MDLTDVGLRERAYRDCPLQGNGGHDYDCHVCVPIMERYRALRDAARAEQREALEIYGSHLTGCLANEAIARHLFGNDRVDYGMPNGVGTYRDEHPDCTCGFSAAIRARKETR